jgi:mono/diheme cytochrome c family protein
MKIVKHVPNVTCFLVLSLLALSDVRGQDEEAVKRGEYILRASGGCTCHSVSGSATFSLAGGRPIKTPFGTMYGTNITPDPETGIGDWSDEDFIKAMTEGVGPDGAVYYPVFPYTSFTKMTREDLLDMKSYLFSLQPVKSENKEHELRFPFSQRSTVSVWRGLYFETGEYEADPNQSAEWNRGAYLSTAVAHCGECHTPRKFLGAVDEEMYYAGSVDGPEGELAPNITPDEETGVGKWSIPDMVWFLQMGFKPDGDDAQGLMGEVITHGYRYLEESDLKAISVYLKSLKPIQNEVKAK